MGEEPQAAAPSRVEAAAIAQRALVATLLRSAGFGLAAGVGLCIWRFPLGAGFLLGLAAGVGAYLWLARTLPKLAAMSPEVIPVYTTRQAMGRIGLYAVAFALAYRLDTEGNMGLIGALGGYMYLRVLLSVHAWRNAPRAD